jgi:hypothetical protein
MAGCSRRAGQRQCRYSAVPLFQEARSHGSTLWIYVGIRPRFGPGPKTAIYAALAVWIVGFLLPNAAFMYVPHLFPNHLTLFTTIGNLVSCLVGTLVGAALYKEA